MSKNLEYCKYKQNADLEELEIGAWETKWKLNVYLSFDISAKYSGIITYAAPAKIPAIMRATYK